MARKYWKPTVLMASISALNSISQEKANGIKNKTRASKKVRQSLKRR
jgi:hypothetical protein